MSIKDIILPKAEVIEACRKGDYSKVAFFLSGKRGKKPRTPLKFFRSNPDTHWLVDYKDEKSQFTLLHHSSLEGQNEISKLLMDFEPLLVVCKSTKNILPIHLASWNGHLEIVKMMLLLPQDKPIDLANAVNIFNESPLHLAVQRGHMNVIQYLLKKNADPFIRNENKENVLDVAARIGHSEAIRLLCQTWPNFPVQSAYESLRTDAADSGKQRSFPAIYPLHLAAKHNHVDCLKILREFGFAIDYTTEDGTALHVASACGQVDAVRYLLSEGINTDIKNQHGQNVLEMIIDLQENRRPEIAQFVKNPEGWKECRSIIEGMDRRDSGRETEGSQSSDTEKETIWQQIPPQASVQFYPDQRKNDSTIYRPPSISANLHDYSPDDNFETDLSIRSDYAYGSHQCSTLNRTWNSKMYDRHTGAPRFPITSPYNQSRHNAYSRTSDTLPVSFSAKKTRGSPQRGSILPEKNSIYDLPPRYNDVALNSKLVNETLSYDNVPRNSALFDNLKKNEIVAPQSKLNRQNGYSTLPTLPKPVGNRIIPQPVRDEAVIGNKLVFNNNQSLNRNQFSLSRTTCDREDSLGLTQSPRLDTRASSVTSYLTCSTIEPEKDHQDNGRAPLALPEEITGSVTGSAIFESPEKEANISNIFESTENHGSDSKPIDNPPSPNTSKAAIFDKLYKTSIITNPTNNSSFFNAVINSSRSTTLSDISSSSPDSMHASLKVSSVQSQSDEDEQRKNPVKIRRQVGCSNLQAASQLPNQSTSGSASVTSSNLDADWDQVTSVFETFGAAPCRESVFVRDYEPRVAVYLRDRGSKALTLHMLDAALQDEMAKNQKPNQVIRVPTKIMTIPEWLEYDVQIASSSARDIGAIFEKYGYDKYTQLKGSMTFDVMSDMGIARGHQLLIMNKIDQIEEKRPNANAFFYVSDWLNSMELTDYLANFINSGLKNMTTIKSAQLDERQLNRLGVKLPGHISRVMYSLQRANDEINWRNQPIAQSTIVQVSNHEPLPPRALRAAQKPIKQCAECPLLDFEKMKKALLKDGIVFRAHQLGTHEISAINGTKEAHMAMQSVKAAIKDWDKIPQVSLELTCDGIRVFDGKKQICHANHGVYTIRVVCQDKKDLNFFSYIARDADNQFFCHTYCVLTSDIATEIINTIGIMFELRSRIDNNQSIEEPINYCPHQRLATREYL